jgi:hypothetical protein
MKAFTVVGSGDERGYVWCADCKDPDAEIERGIALGIVQSSGYPFLIYEGSAPHAFDTCERCGRVLNDARREVSA